MRHGAQGTPPDTSRTPSHERARCTPCQSILYPVPILYDGVPVGGLTWRCPHCDDKRPLDPAVVRRIESMRAQAMQAEAERTATEAATRAYRERSLMAAETKRRTDDQHRAQIIQAIQRFAARHGRPPSQVEMGHSGPVRVDGLASRSLVARLFGAPRHALEAAGFPAAARTSGNTRKGRGMAMRRYAA